MSARKRIVVEKEVKPKAKMGRPTKYTPELADEICRAVASNACGLEKICAMYPHFPDKVTIREWRLDKADFSLNYARAKLVQADLLAEELLDISDNCRYDAILDKDGNEICNGEYIARSRLRVDTRKWLASKLMPRMYGDTVKAADESESELLKKEARKKASKAKSSKHAKDF